jgi:hypothetical protein
MTTTRLNPANEGYELTTVPPTKSDRSRFALGRLAEGWDSPSPAAAVAQAYERLLIQRQEEAAPIVPEKKTVALKYVRRDAGSGDWVIRNRGSVEAVPTFAGTPPSRFSRLRSTGGALLDELLLGGDAWDKARDDAVWDALRELCEAEFPDGLTLRRLNEAVALALLLRHGIDLRPDQLPQEHLREQPKEGAEQ